jgi:hypothetical protein
MATHVKIVAALFFVIAAFCFLMALFAPALLAFLGSVVGSTGEPEAGAAAIFLGLTGVVLSLVMVVLGLPYAICGYGLLKFRPWGRIMAIILAAIALTKVPFGTLIGIYALIVLFQKKTEELFVPTSGVVS